MHHRQTQRAQREHTCAAGGNPGPVWMDRRHRPQYASTILLILTVTG
jgi:hypothetical protein